MILRRAMTPMIEDADDKVTLTEIADAAVGTDSMDDADDT